MKGESLSAVARHVDVADSVLRRWRVQLEPEIQDANAKISKAATARQARANGIRQDAEAQQATATGNNGTATGFEIAPVETTGLAVMPVLAMTLTIVEELRRERDRLDRLIAALSEQAGAM
tara:strand:- start:5273 stop:5635 length:363 start_codon:yes stop_codon:yes gene_type:complete